MSAPPQKNALIPRSPSALEGIGSGSREILSRIVFDALVLARQTRSGEEYFRNRGGYSTVQDWVPKVSKHPKS